MKSAGEKAPDRIKEEDGEWLVPVLKGISFEDEMEAQAYLIADNQLTNLGGWNTSTLVDNLQELVTGGFSLDGIGFDLDDLETLVLDLDRDHFEVEDIPEADDEETDVKIRVGRYRFTIDAEAFYMWEEKIADEIGSRSSEDFIDWLRESIKIYLPKVVANNKSSKIKLEDIRVVTNVLLSLSLYKPSKKFRGFIFV